MKIKLFTHTDLDGVGCAVVANHFFGAENVDVTYCDYKEVDEKVIAFYSGDQDIYYDRVYITDISIKKETVDRIGREIKGLYLIDHHATAEWLNEYVDWAMVMPTWFSGIKTSATDLFAWYLQERTPIEDEKYFALAEFAEKVRRWDTWDWHNVYSDNHAKRLNNLVYLVGRHVFLDRFTDSLDIAFTEAETLVLELEEDKIKKYIEKVGKTVKVKKIAGYKAGVVFAESYSSELGNALAEANPELDFIAIINALQGSVSYRGVKEHIDLGKEVAALYGGGGHPRASGSGISEVVLNQFINSVFPDVPVEITIGG